MSSESYFMTNIFAGLLFSTLFVFIFAYICIQIAKFSKLIDYPGSASHKIHSRPTPIAGGVTIVFSLLISSLVFGILQKPIVMVIFVAGIIIFILGVIDDLRDIHPIIKLGGQVLTAIVMIRMGLYIQIFESPEFFIRGSAEANTFLDWVLTVIWIVGITNAFNFVDSMDGLAVGLGGITAIFFMLVTLESQQYTLSLINALVVGICMGLFFYNSRPALLFLGDSGSQTLGFILAAIAIAYRPQGVSQSSSWFVPILVMGVPIFDAALVIVSRLRRRQPVYKAALDHTYHRLVKIGLNSNRAVMLMQGAAFILGCVAFVLLLIPPLIANILFVCILLIGLLFLIYLENKLGSNKDS